MGCLCKVDGLIYARLKGQGLWLVLDESMALLYFILNSG
jgi:hypothetical protein